MTTYTPTKSADGRDWPAQLAADPTLWDRQYGDWLTENEAEWRDRLTETDWYETKPGGSLLHAFAEVPYGQLPYHCRPPYLAYLTGRLVGLLDERRHGVERCGCGNGKVFYAVDDGAKKHFSYPCKRCVGIGTVPTFATLFDREDVCRNCCGDKSIYCDRCKGEVILIPGYLGDLARWMRHCGDPRAEAVGSIRVDKWHRDFATGEKNERWDVWYGVPPQWASESAYATYPDACREAIRRVHAMLARRCGQCEYNQVPRALVGGKCADCLGQGWLAVSA